MQNQQNQFDLQQLNSQSYSNDTTSSQHREELSSSMPIDRYPQDRFAVFLSEFAEARSQLAVSLVGYGLLVFSLCDYIQILTPLHLMNSLWEFQTMGALVEHVATPLLGFALIFYRRQGYIQELERKLLGCLSWLCLLLGVLYLLMLPLGVVNTWRIFYTNISEVNTQISQQSQPLQNLTAQLDRAKTNEQIEQLFSTLTPSKQIPQLKNPQAVKTKLLDQISQTQKNLQKQVQAVGTSNRGTLIRNSIKWNLGAVISGTLFVALWFLTDWARYGRY